MKILKGGSITGRITAVHEVFTFLWERKLWWLIPVVGLLFLISLLLILAQLTAAAPWLYPL